MTSTVVIPRSHAPGEEAADGLRQGLGLRCHVRITTGSTLTPSSARGTDQPHMILVGTGSNCVFRAAMAISRAPGRPSFP